MPLRFSPSRLLFAGLKLLLLAGFVWLKATSLWGHAPVYSGDGRVWAEIGSEPFSSIFLLLPRRPIVYPLLFKLVGFHDPAILVVQGVLSTLGWAAFAQALSRLAAPGIVSTLTFALTLMVALTTPVHAWDVVIRSESTAMSFVVLALALSLRVLSRARVRPKHLGFLAAASALMALLAAFSRDPSAYLMILFSAVIAYGGFVLYRGPLRARLKRRGLRVALALALSFGAASALAQVNCRLSDRFQFSLMNVIFQRVLGSPMKLSYFVNELGMPLVPELGRFRGKFASFAHRRAFTMPELESFRVWVRARGYPGYQRYLLSHPLFTAQEALAMLPAVTGQSSLKLGRSSPTRITAQLDELWVSGALSRYPAEGALGMTLLGGAGLFAKRRRGRLLGALTLFFALGGLSQLYICYHADAMEVQRHSTMVGTLLRLSGVCGLSLLFALGGSIYRRISVMRQRQA